MHLHLANANLIAKMFFDLCDSHYISVTNTSKSDFTFVFAFARYKYALVACNSAIRKAAVFTVPGHSMTSTGTTPVEQKKVHCL